MLRRLLLDPKATEGGAATTTPPAPTPPAPPPAPATVTLPADELASLYDARRKLSDFEVNQQKALEAKEQERLLVVAQKGDVDKAFEKFKGDAGAKYTTLEQKFLDRERSLVVAEALNGRTFVSADAATQARELLGHRIESVLGADGSVIVRDKLTGKPAAGVIKELLDSPAFAHYQPARTQGGAGGGGGDPPPDGGQGPKPGSIEAIAASYKKSQGEYASWGLGPVAKS